MNKKAFSPIEEIIVLVMISIFIGVLYNKYNTLAFRAKIEQTKIDLYNLQLAVKLFRVRNGRYPNNLYNLYEQEHLKGILQKSFLKQHKVVDPFGNLYVYDNRTGTVLLNKRTYELIHGKRS